MDNQVPYLPEEAIERDAEVLLAEYEFARDVTITPPVPIEDIVEKHLKLRFEFDDAHTMLGFPRTSGQEADILGAIFFDERRIVIDESLDPVENPAKEGRYRFTLAHESSHWRLHRSLFATNPNQIPLFDQPAVPSFICRLSQREVRAEWQADFHASCTLMPRKLVLAVWNEMFPDQKQRVLQPTASIDHPFVEIARFDRGYPCVEIAETDDIALDRFARPLAKRFLVSPIAMRIRLEKLGLLQREVPRQRFLVNRS
jgi:Zn-dependent peptidase ImmA (M78 family)